MAAARAVLQGTPGRRDVDDAMRAFGLDPAALDDGPVDTGGVEVWPDNADAVRLFVAMATQWRMGSGGPVGLDYGIVPQLARHLGLRKRRLRAAFNGLQVMEAAALDWVDQQLQAQTRH